MKVVITGSRDWSEVGIIKARLKLLPSNTTVIHGTCRGADEMAGKAAEELGLHVVPYHADWHRHGKGAGPIRNRKMLDQVPDLVIAFHDDLENSKGTKDCVDEARRRGFSIEIHSVKRRENA